MLQRVHRRYRLPPATAAGCGRCAASTRPGRCLIDHPVAVGRRTNQETRGRERKGACERLAPSAKAAVAPTGVVRTSYSREARDGRRRRPAAILF